MEIKVYQSQPDDNSCYLKLSQVGTHVRLLVVDANGCDRYNGIIAELGERGLHLYPVINKAIGLPLDNEGKIKIV
jgi:hypothetical protein